MNQQQAYIALDWVKQALDDTLKTIRDNLSARPEPELHTAYQGLHQVSGTLHMMQLNEPLVLAEALEQFCHGLQHGQLAKNQIAELQVGVDLLLHSLDQLQRVKKSNVLAIYRMVNHLRQLQSHELLKSKDWIQLELSQIVTPDQYMQPIDLASRQLLARAYRHFLSLLLQDKHIDESAGQLFQLAGLIRQGAATLQQAAQWQVAEVIHEAMALHALITDTPTRQILSRLETSLRHIDLNVEELLFDSLSLIESHDIPTAAAARLMRWFRGEIRVDGMSSRLLDSVLLLLQQAQAELGQENSESLTHIRDVSHLLEISGWQKLDEKARLVQALLESVGAGVELKADQRTLLDSQLQALIADVTDHVELLSASNNDNDQLVNNAQIAAVRESRAALESVKDALVSYNQRRWEAAALQAVPEQLTMLRGALQIMNLDDAATVVDHFLNSMQQTVIRADYRPNWRQVDILAECVASIEYYLDQLASQYRDDKILIRAIEALTQYELPVNEPAPVSAGGDKIYHDEQGVPEAESESAIIPAPLESEKSEHPERSIQEQAITEQAAEMPAPSAATPLLDVGATPVVPVAAETSSRVLPEDDFDQDDEIREIFIEEAGEVLENIDEHFPVWSADFSDSAALKEFRRGFHTLKGSGRMVGARVVGELAWSIENMLNRVLDNTITPTPDMVSLIQEVLKAVPGMVQDYADGKPAQFNPSALIDTAEAMTKGVWKGHAPAHASLNDFAPQTASPPPVSAPETEHARVTEPKPETTLALDASEQSASEQSASEQPAIENNVAVSIVAEASADSTAAGYTLKPEVVAGIAAEIVPQDDFDQDDEIREIFIEEVQEVMESIHEYFPQWAANTDNIDALKEFRRGFHTLKGSGRMVGAKAEGELAWSIENMLNRVLDKSIPATPAMIELISHVIEVIPVLVQDFAEKRAPSIALAPLMFLAHQMTISKPYALADIQGTPTATEATPAAISSSQDVENSASSLAAKPQANLSIPKAVDEEAISPDEFDALANALNAEFDATTGTGPENAVPATASLDPQLLEIFVSEAEGYLDDITHYLNDNPQGGPISETLIRALHTLRGSAGMSGVDAIYRMGMSMENECRRLMRENQPLSAKHADLLRRLHARVRDHLDTVSDEATTILHPVDLTLISDIDLIASSHGDLTDSEESGGSTHGLVAELMKLPMDELLDAEWELESRASQVDASGYFSTLSEQLKALNKAVLNTVAKPMASLTGRMARVYGLASKQSDTVVTEAWLELMLQAHTALTGMFDALASGHFAAEETVLIERLNEWLITALDLGDAEGQQNLAGADSAATTKPQTLSEHSAAPTAAQAVQEIKDSAFDPDLLEIFLEEAEEILGNIDQSFLEWQSQPDNVKALGVLQRHLHTLKGGARMAQVQSIGDLGHEMETIYERLVAGRDKSSPELIRFMRHCQDVIARQVDGLIQQQQSFFAPRELETLLAYQKDSNKGVLADFFSTAATGSTKSTVAAPTPTMPAAAVSVAETQPSASIAAPASQPDESKAAVPSSGMRQMHVLAEAWDEGNAPDPEMLEIFLDEAGDIIDETSTQLATWLKDTGNSKVLLELQRGLHTLKGGARMAGVETLGDLAHEMEFVYEDLGLGRKPVTDVIGQVLSQCHDWLADAVGVLDQGEKPVRPSELIEALEKFRKDPHSLTSVPQIQRAELDLPAVDVAASSTTESQRVMGAEPPPMTGLFQRTDRSDQSSNEMIRVSAGLMEKMINLSGENAINRSRIEMGVSSFTQTIEDMGSTVQRLAEQLRRMEGELESQILARHEGEREKYADFDPLEMDQYSSLNQLSKSLFESASDLLDFKATLLDKARDAESLLLQQSRIQSELQEGLMKSRLVPFSRLVPRLQRIVRQTATELGKPAELMIQNAEGELDRTVLERIVAPLEHMLRNAVDHGLEMPEGRSQAKKNPTGTIILNVSREGGEIVITLKDDGRGINVDAVRKKAIERGLMAADADLSDQEIMQFIFNAGLSTASQVTQISGRGVGMDVVISEIKQMGGLITVDSVTGKGSTFTIRLPLTVAVTDALMVRVGDRTFAIPLSQIEHIRRASPIELEKFYKSDREEYVVDGQSYRVRYLGEFITGTKMPELYGQVLPLPLILVKNASHNIAIQVDHLVGSRAEIVVKPVGQQLVSVNGISGATILGDGSVVVILDLLALSRTAASRARTRDVAPTVDASAHVRKTVMVVDDSVTVRKVTTRLLERQGFDVVTAKDGVDAIAKLEDVNPDIMLLDIEMPRMDGFEVANLVRHNSKLAELPIIMITSRTGEKHRERAFQIGVNCYMGKPFQEGELLENIHELLGMPVN